MDDTKKVAWKARCPVDGDQYLKRSGIHVIIRSGMETNVVTYFCPHCNVQRFQIVKKTVSRLLIDDMKCAWSVMQVPAEALEVHYGAPILEGEIAAAVKLMDKFGWSPKL